MKVISTIMSVQIREYAEIYLTKLFHSLIFNILHHIHANTTFYERKTIRIAVPIKMFIRVPKKTTNNSTNSATKQFKVKSTWKLAI